MNETGWLDDACQQVLSPSGTHIDRQARHLGMRAAEASLDLADLSIALVRAAQQRNTDKGSIDFLGRLLTAITASTDAYRHHSRTALARNDAERTALVNDLLTGRPTKPHGNDYRLHEAIMGWPG
jgi:hypothetical protein